MLLDNTNWTVNLTYTRYCESRFSDLNVLSNVSRRRTHTMYLAVKDGVLTQSVDDIPQSTVKTRLENYRGGYVSLASNSVVNQYGAFLHVRLRSPDGGFEVDFSKTPVSKLDHDFQSWYFENLGRSAVGSPQKFGRCWKLENHTVLKCNRMFLTHKEFFTLLTYSRQRFTDFELWVTFEQCWNRYGVVFGAEEGGFPYSGGADGARLQPGSGVLAYVEAEGSRTAAGRIDPSEYQRGDCVKRVVEPEEKRFSQFGKAEPYPTHIPFYNALSFRKKSDLVLHLADRDIAVGDNSIVFVPAKQETGQNFTVDSPYCIYFELFNNIATEVEIYYPRDPERFEKYFRDIHEIWMTYRPGYKYECTSLFYKMLADLQAEQEGDGAHIPESILPSYEYMKNNFTDPQLTVRSLAAMSGISEVYFRRLFHEAVGVYPKKYIQNMRLEYAISLINSGRYKISEVAEKAGFLDAKYFSTAFKKMVGIPPSQYHIE